MSTQQQTRAALDLLTSILSDNEICPGQLVCEEKEMGTVVCTCCERPCTQVTRQACWYVWTLEQLQPKGE